MQSGPNPTHSFVLRHHGLLSPWAKSPFPFLYLSMAQDLFSSSYGPGSPFFSTLRGQIFYFLLSFFFSFPWARFFLLLWAWLLVIFRTSTPCFANLGCKLCVDGACLLESKADLEISSSRFLRIKCYWFLVA